MRLIGRTGIVLGCAALVAAVVVGLWPLHRNGVSGNALRPHYSRYFAFAVGGPLPDRPTRADLRRAGVVFPTDAVHDRRLLVSEVFACATLLLVAGAAAARPSGLYPLSVVVRARVATPTG